MTGRPVPYWPTPLADDVLADEIAAEIVEAAQAAYGHTPQAFTQAMVAVAATTQIRFPEAVPAVGVAAG
jgi:hypothetical protein